MALAQYALARVSLVLSHLNLLATAPMPMFTSTAQPLRAPTMAARLRPALSACLLAALLAGCQALPTPPKEPLRYDLGSAPIAAQHPSAQPGSLVLADIQAPWQAEGSTTAMHYRLAYDQPHALFAYSQASWRLPPELLVQERLRQWLSQGGRTVLSAEGGRIPPLVNAQGAASVPPTLSLALEEFHQSFDDAQRSQARVRLRATLTGWQGGTDVLLGQRLFTAHTPAPSADAAGGAQALAEGIDAIGAQLIDWLQQLAPARSAP